MFWFKGSKKFLEKDLEHLVKEGINSELKSIIKIANPSDMTDCTGMTILHLAAKYNNLELTEFLLNSRYDINAKNSCGITPLLTAIVHSSFEVVKLLLDANADVSISNNVGEMPLQLLMDKENDTPAYIIEHLLKNLKRSSLNAEEMSRVLLEANCSLEFVLQLENADVTQLMLNRTEEISMDRAHDLLICAMNLSYLDNVKVLLHHGHKASYRREKFLENLSNRIKGSDVELESARPFLQQLENWNVIDAKFVLFLQQVFEESNKEVLELLLQCDVEVFVRKKFGRDLLVHMFINRNEHVIELLHNKNFNVDARDKDGRTGLHIAAMHTFPERIQFLLDRAANPNIKDKRGRTPLLVAWDAQCIEFLIGGGADIQVVDYSGLTVFDMTNNLSAAVEVLLAHLAIVDARDVSIKRRIADRVDLKREFKEFYDKCKMQLDWMKTHVIHGSLTMFTALIKKPEDLTCYVRGQQTVTTILTHIRKQKLHSFYISTLEDRFNKTLEIHNNERVDA